jgi:hypothetical protein
MAWSLVPEPAAAGGGGDVATLPTLLAVGVERTSRAPATAASVSDGTPGTRRRTGSSSPRASPRASPRGTPLRGASRHGSSFSGGDASPSRDGASESAPLAAPVTSGGVLLLMLSPTAGGGGSPVGWAPRDSLRVWGELRISDHDSDAARNAKIAVVAVAWARRGRLVAGGCSDGAVRLWDAAAAAVNSDIHSLSDAVRSLAASDASAAHAHACAMPELAVFGGHRVATPVLELAFVEVTPTRT